MSWTMLALNWQRTNLSASTISQRRWSRPIREQGSVKEELANIIWDEADDHIVPYPEESEKKSQSAFVGHDNNEANEEPANSKPSEQKPAATETKLHGGKLESNDDLSLHASNPDLNCIGKKTNLEKGPEISEDQNEDRELGDIIGNSWANIGSFDDLDNIFSNDELVDHASLDSTDELWTSSRDVIDSSVKSSSLDLDSTSWGLEALGNSSSEFNFNTEYLHNENQSLASGYEKAPESTCYTQQRLHSRFDRGEFDFTAGPKHISEKTASDMTEKIMSETQVATRKLASTSKSLNKDNWSRSQSKHVLKSDKINNNRRSRDIYGTWSPPGINVQQFDGQSMPSTPKSYPPSVLGQQPMPQQSTCLPYEQFSNPYLAGYSYGNLSDQCTTMPVLPARDDEDQPVLSNAEACVNERVSMATRPQKMTPQEKIEKLRRRQQMRAMLAIKKQQQQLNHPVPITDCSVAQKSSQEDQFLHLERSDFECEEKLTPTYDPNSPLKQDDCSAISVEVDDQNVEDTVLYQLQDIVTKLDMKIRLCIRDSLFRLAQSAMQRHYASDLSSANRSGCDPIIVKEDLTNQESFIQMPSAETETNYIDRAVAHLLFHRPFKSSVKHSGTPESSISPKMPPDLEMGASSSLPMSFVTKSSENEQNPSTHGSNAPCPFKEPQQEDLSEQPLTDVSMNQKMKRKMVESV